MSTLKEWLRDSPERERVFAQERLIVSVAEAVWEQLEERGITQAEIANFLGKSKAYVSQILDGSRNMTLRTLSDLAFALGGEIDIHFKQKLEAEGWCTTSASANSRGSSVSALFALDVGHEAANEWETATNVSAPHADVA
jgi:transcriptional regulator with XRE-family HTH domain